MELIKRAEGQPSALAILAGAFHPPTRAHVALAEAGMGYADQVLLVLPKRFPHKEYEQVGLAERLRMVQEIVKRRPRFSLGVSEGGLFVEIARECRQIYGPGVRLLFLCGSDAAERMLSWNYGCPGAIREMLKEFELVVARRGGSFEPPLEYQDRIHVVELAAELETVSATEVRRRIAAGEPWEDLVPPEIVGLVCQLYGALKQSESRPPGTP